jgi:hypothetical protein
MRGLTTFAFGLIILMVLTPCGVSYSRAWLVPSECSTIHAGLDSTSYGDTVLVAPGTYWTSDTLDTWVHLRAGVTLMSEEGPEVTIIEVCNGMLGIAAMRCEGARASGFTIRFGTGPNCGLPPAPTSGVHIYECTNLVVEDCIIHGFDYGLDVSGASSEWWKPVFRNNIIYNCTDGIHCVNVRAAGRPFFEDNTITECNFGAWINDSGPNFVGNRICSNTHDGMSYGGWSSGNCKANVIADNGGHGVSIWSDPPPSFNGGLEMSMANDFYGNGGYDIEYNHDPDAWGLTAKINYWGSDCPDFSLKVKGRVFYSPWVDSTHTVRLDEEDCPGATEPSTWGSIKAMFR